jgi:sulfite exporter TauE/SafE
MSPSLDLFAAFAAGLLASGHCVGMCGSLVSAFFIKFGGGGALPYVSYHAGRLAVYALAGLVAAALGAALVSTGLFGKMQAVLQIVAGAVVILLGLEILGLSPLRLAAFKLPAAWLRATFLAAARRGPVVGAGLGGVLNGMMPCALTLAMAVKATTVDHAWQGAALMLAFGAGTLPSMLFASAVFGKLAPRLRGLLLKAAAVFVVGLGVATLLQGVRYLWVMRNLANW